MLDKELSQSLQDLMNLIGVRNFFNSAQQDSHLVPKDQRVLVNENILTLNSLIMSTTSDLMKQFKKSPSLAKEEVIDFEKIKAEKKAQKAKKLADIQSRSSMSENENSEPPEAA